MRRISTNVFLFTYLFCLSGFAGTGSLNDYNNWDEDIPDNGASVNTDLSLSGAPSDSTVTKVKIYYEIEHPRPSDLDVWLTCYDDGWQGDYYLHSQGNSSSVDGISVDNIHTWDGGDPNVTWYLVAQDRVSGSVGYISFFELWVSYAYNEAPNTPSSEDPDDGDTGVSRTTNLDWGCSDPDSDTLYYTVYFEKNDSSPDTTIKTDSAGSYADPGTLDYDSHYYWQVKADDHNGGVTWGPVWDFYTEAEPVIDADITGVSFDRSEVKRGVQAITATVTLKNTGNQSWTFYVGGSSIKSGESTWYDWSPSRASKTLSANQSGSVQLSWAVPAGASLGSYGFFSKAFTDSSGDDFVDDDWQDGVFDVIEPVNSGQITGASFDDTSVTRGADTVTATVTINNTGDQSYTFYLGGSCIRSGDTTWYDWSPSRASKTIASGASDSVEVSWACPSGASVGNYGFYSKLFKSSSGDDYFDEDWQDAAFDVVDQVLPEISTGRIAWHSYSEYDDDPPTADGYRSLDGTIRVYDFSSGAHNTRAENTISAGVLHAMNPNFSSDGRYITFMGLPKTRTYSHYESWAEYLDIFVYDFQDDRLVNISTNIGRGAYNQFEEDPVFSPDGQWVAFKRQRSDIWAARLSDYQVRQVTAGAGEESGPQYSPDGSWITFWVGDGAEAYIAKVAASSVSETSYTLVLDNDVAGDEGIQDYFPSYWDSSRLIYTSWDTAQLPGTNDDDDIRIRDLSSGSDYLAAFNSSYPVDDSDAFSITTELLGFSKRQGTYWGLWYGDPLVGGAVSLGIADANRHNLGGEYTTTVVNYVPNSSPTDLTLSSASISENQPSGTTVGVLSTTDPDIGNTFGYTLVSGAGDGDNSSFGISGNLLETAAVFNYEAKNSYEVRVRTIDQGGLWYEEAFTVTITDENDPPSDLDISVSSVAENEDPGTVVGTFSSTDVEPPGGPFVYGLVSGAGDADNGSFTVLGDVLKTSVSFDYETKDSYTIRVRTTDQGSLWYEETVVVSIADINEAPMDVSLSGNSVPENEPSGTLVGTLSTTDPEPPAGSFSYSLVSGVGDADNASFTIAGDQLKTGEPFDYEMKSTYSIRIRSTDQGSLWHEESFTVTVTDVDDSDMDTDGDGIPDWYELLHGGNTTNMSPYGHSDSDGVNNGDEWVANTDPADHTDYFHIAPDCHMNGDSFVLCWMSSSNRFYHLYRSLDLREGGADLLSANIPGTPPMNTYTDVTAMAAGACAFYDVEVTIDPIEQLTWIVDNGGFSISNGVLTETEKGGASGHFASVHASVEGNVTSFRTHFTNPPQGGRGEHQMSFWMTDDQPMDSANGYLAILYWDAADWGSPEQYMDLIRVDSGTWNVIVSGASSAITRDSARHAIELAVDGGNIQVKLDGVVKISTFDDTYSVFNRVTIMSYMKYYDLDAVFDGIVVVTQ